MVDYMLSVYWLLIAINASLQAEYFQTGNSERMSASKVLLIFGFNFHCLSAFIAWLAT